MDFLGIGPLELVFVLILAMLVLGPDELAKTGKTVGRFLSKAAKSETWLAVRSFSKEMRNLPTKLAREANIEEYLKEHPEKKIAPPKTKTIEQSEPIDQDSHAQDEDQGETSMEHALAAWTTPPETKKAKDEGEETEEQV